VRAASCARASLAHVIEIDMPFTRLAATLLCANVCLAAGRNAEGQAFLEQARQVEETWPSGVHSYYRLVLEADVAFREGRRAEGIATLAQAFGAGRRIGMWNVAFSRERLAVLCVEALEADVEVDYVCELIRRLGLFPEREPVLASAWPWRIEVFTLG